MERPNAFRHMFVWGVLSGTILGIIYSVTYAWILFGLDTPYWDSLLEVIWSGLVIGTVWGAGFGFVAGFIMGIIDGIVLRQNLNTLQYPYAPAQITERRKVVLPLMGILTFIGVNIIWSIMAFGLFTITVPASFIALGMSVYVTHRYMKHLLEMSEKPKGKPKRATE